MRSRGLAVQIPVQKLARFGHCLQGAPRTEVTGVAADGKEARETGEEGDSCRAAARLFTRAAHLTSTAVPTHNRAC